jgi:hypothetical protein
VNSAQMLAQERNWAWTSQLVEVHVMQGFLAQPQDIDGSSHVYGPKALWLFPGAGRPNANLMVQITMASLLQKQCK